MTTATTTAHQPSFEELGTPLYDATFVVVDLETTGLSPAADRITEIGAVKVRRGEVLGEMQTLVDPGRTIPPAVTAVTGITDGMVTGQPPVAAVLPMFLEFVRDAVLVAHNARFDTGFLGAELERHGYPPLSNVVVDTAAVARRVLRDEVRNVRLETLAKHLRARTSPTHRALIDARATVDVLHGLLERAGTLGATTIEDLQDYTKSTTDRAFRKISLVGDAPESAGVYRFHDDRGVVLYVGKATDLRSRLRRYFGGDRRRRIADLVRDTSQVTWDETPTLLEAEVREVRAIHARRPRYNRRSKNPQRVVWIKTTTEPFPRLSVVTSRRDDDATYVGPLRSRKAAERVIEAVHEVMPLRRCTTRLRVAQDHPSCVLKDLGRCGSPCDGTQSREDYAGVVDQYREAVTGDPAPLLEPLRRRMTALSRASRFERAQDLRARLHAVARVLASARRQQQLEGVDRLIALRPDGPDCEAVLLARGRLLASVRLPTGTADHRVVDLLESRATASPLPGIDDPWLHEELTLIRDWLDGDGVTVLHAEPGFCEPVAGGALLTRTVTESRRVARQVRRDRQTLTRAKVVRAKVATRG